MMGATRHFEASFSIIEWMLEERRHDLTPEEIEALETYHSVLVRTSEDLWDVQPPKLPEKMGHVPLGSELDQEYFKENY